VLVGLPRAIGTDPATVLELVEALTGTLGGEAGGALDGGAPERAVGGAPGPFVRVEAKREVNQREEGAKGRVAHPSHLGEHRVGNRNAKEARRKGDGGVERKAAFVGLAKGTSPRATLPGGRLLRSAVPAFRRGAFR
jgi:hypothetical protein